MIKIENIIDSFEYIGKVHTLDYIGWESRIEFPIIEVNQRCFIDISDEISKFDGKFVRVLIEVYEKEGDNNK